MSLRHTCASELANEDNQNLKLIAEYLGHRALNTTTKYVHASQVLRRDFMKRIGVQHDYRLLLTSTNISSAY